MKVAIYSELKAERKLVGRHHGGTKICYLANNARKDYSTIKYFYTVTFTHTFENANNTVYFAYSVPYTLSDLRSDLAFIE